MLELIRTGDGSDSLYNSALDEHYHSVHGAITESRHVFLEACFHEFTGKKINLLEIGFGTGLNAVLTLLAALESGRVVHYTGIEKYPLKQEILASLNYPDILPGSADFLNRIHLSAWGKKTEIAQGFILKKVSKDISDLDDTDRYDVVYFDAFSPSKQPELWTSEVFRRIYQSMRSGAVLSTYSSKGEVRRNLTGAGFRVEKLPGPPGKREMTRAWKK